MFKKEIKYPENLRLQSLQNYFEDVKQEAVSASIKIDDDNKPKDPEKSFSVHYDHFQSTYQGWLKIFQLVR